MLTRKKFFLLLFTAVAMIEWTAEAQSKTPALTSTAILWVSPEVKTNATGSSRKFFEGSTANLEMIECHASTLNPGATNHVILSRPNDEVIIVKDGILEVYVGDKWVRVGPGSVIFNAANTPQSMWNPGGVPVEYHVITFRPTSPKRSTSEKQN